MSGKVSREDVKRIVAVYLGEPSVQPGVLHVLDIRETGLRGRAFVDGRDFDECWVAYLPNEAAAPPLSPSRIICINKDTGNIIYDGCEGGSWRKTKQASSCGAAGCGKGDDETAAANDDRSAA